MRRVALLLAVLAIGLPAPVRADVPLPAGHPLFGLVPGDATAPAPDWVRPGLRLTYAHQGAASTGNPDDLGAYVDAFMEIDVLARDADVAIHSVREIERPRAGRSRQLSAAGEVAPSCGGSGAWIHPALLRRAAVGNREGVTIDAFPYPFEAGSVASLRIHITRENHLSTWYYSRDEGLLLEALPANPPPELGETRGLRNHLKLSGRRQRDLPWAGDPAPDWIRTVRSLTWQGTHTTRFPSGPGPVLMLTARATVLRRGADWLEFEQVLTAGGGPGGVTELSRARQVSGTAQVGGLWIPPRTLAALKEGRVVDRDPLTQVTTTVTRVRRAADGGGEVTVTEEGLSFRAERGYDLKTGALVKIRFVDQVSPESGTSTEILLEKE